MNKITDNQTLDTNQSINQTQNELNLNSRQTNQPNLLPNMNNNSQNNPVFAPTFNPQNNPVFAPTFNPQNNPVFAPTFNPQNNPVFAPTFNPQNNPVFAPTFNPVFSPTFTPVIQNQPPQVEVKVENKLPVSQVKTKTTRTIPGPLDLGLEPKKISCPFCEKEITTNIKKSTNMKALLTAIATLYIGFVMIQTCRGKAVSWEDCEHSCPDCNHKVGSYRAM